MMNLQGYYPRYFKGIRQFRSFIIAGEVAKKSSLLIIVYVGSRVIWIGIKLFNIMTKYISKPCRFTNGIPQGSCLGPTLFIFVYSLNYIFKYLEDVKFLMFADDCVLYQSGKDWNYIRTYW